MTADERLTLIRVKIERANKHIRDLEVELTAFKKEHPYTGSPKIYPQTGYSIYQADSVPDSLSIPALRDKIIPTTGDAIHNLRSALDHLAWQLSAVTGFVDVTGTPLTEKQLREISFPIIDTDDPAKYKTSRAGKVQAMRPSAVKLIDEIEPYKGGKGNGLWVLHKLDAIEKHRALLATLTDVKSIDFRVLNDKGKPTGFGYELKTFSLFGDHVPLKPALKAGDVLFIREGKANEDVQLVIEVTFSEPGIIEGQPILPTLVQMANYIDTLILSFRDELA